MRIAASAAAKKWDSRPTSGSANRRQPRSLALNPSGTWYEKGQLFALYRRRLRPIGGRSVKGVVGFLFRKRLPESVHAIQRVESALARGSEGSNSTGA